jgi:hypothetical protein
MQSLTLARLEELVLTGQAHRVFQGGYPSSYLIRAGEFRNSATELDPNEWNYVAAWDMS